LSKKPHTVGAKLSPAFDKSRKWGQGSDMFCPDERLILAKLNKTHDLALNLFCVDRPQLLILTLDSYRRQHEPLDVDDFAVALEVRKRFPDHYVIFNCSETGGCSRIHKHLQGLKGPPHAFDFMIRSKDAGHKPPFQYFTHRYDEKATSTALAEAYRKLLDQCRSVLDLSESDVCPHNVVIWDGCLIVIPRRKGAIEGASANTGGMMGSVWVTEQAQVDEWERLGFAHVLRELGVPVPTDVSENVDAW
jgi:ATP adenylyltransferase/5',5'''-P-1,P-4-tetraphosphate phosphorylase II